MEQLDKHFIAVIGGFWELDKTDATKGAAARTAGKRLGAELAKAGFGLVVYFSNDESLEPHVVEGYADAVPPGSGAGAIRVRFAESQRGQVRFAAENTRPELFVHRLFPSQDWEAPFYRSLAEEDEKEHVDAVLLLAGAVSTLIAGQIALARQLPILAVEEFGGSAAKIWNYLAQVSRDNNYPAWATSKPSDLVKRVQEACAEAAAERQGALERERLFAAMTGERAQIQARNETQRRQAAFAAGAFLALLATSAYALVYTQSSAYPVVTLLGLISAGATGALARTVFWGPESNDPWASLLLGGVAGFVVGLAYLIPALVGAPLTLTPGNDHDAGIARVEFLSIVLVALSAGVGFDTVFSRLREQARELNVEPQIQPTAPKRKGSTSPPSKVRRQ
jgi:hypothetical protein